MEAIAPSPSKDKYMVSNWQDYNQSLVRRGSIEVWIEDSVVREWKGLSKTGKVVGEKYYSDRLIECCLVLGAVYRLPLRQTQGFSGSVFRLLGLDCPIPNYTTLSRRQGVLNLEVSTRLKDGEKMVVAVDSTGLKVFGEGEWKVRKHGASKRRTWRKLHIGIDVGTQRVVMAVLTGNDQDDAKVAAEALKGKTDRIEAFLGDGAYDDFEFRKVLGKDIRQIIPPPKDAVVRKGTKKKPLDPALEQRNQAVKDIAQQGRAQWKKQVGYHKRSLSEVAMFRYKTTFGGGMSARKTSNQKAEASIKCRILNKMADCGMPKSYRCPAA